MSVKAAVGQLTVIALMGFIHRLLVSVHVRSSLRSWHHAALFCASLLFRSQNFVKELKVSEGTIKNVKQSARDGASAAVTKVSHL